MTRLMTISLAVRAMAGCGGTAATAPPARTVTVERVAPEPTTQDCLNQRTGAFEQVPVGTCPIGGLR